MLEFPARPPSAASWLTRPYRMFSVVMRSCHQPQAVFQCLSSKLSSRATIQLQERFSASKTRTRLQLYAFLSVGCLTCQKLGTREAKYLLCNVIHALIVIRRFCAYDQIALSSTHYAQSFTALHSIIACASLLFLNCSAVVCFHCRAPLGTAHLDPQSAVHDKVLPCSGQLITNIT